MLIINAWLFLLNHEQDSDMAEGTVKWFNKRKGYGFISPEADEKDIFIHISAIKDAGLRALNEGDKIIFDTTTERDRVVATNIKLK